MRILGVDPGTVTAGYGVIDQPARQTGGPGRPSNALLYIASGNIQAVRTAPMSARLRALLQRLTAIIDEYAPDCVAVEEPFVDKNIKTALKLGQAEGVALVAAELAGLPVTVYSPATIKLALTGYGRAEKEQIGQMVKRLLRIESVPSSHHVSDALAVAICHAHSAAHAAVMTGHAAVGQTAVPAGRVRRAGLRRLSQGALRGLRTP